MYLDRAYYIRFLKKTGEHNNIELDTLSYEELVKLFNAFMYSRRKKAVRM